MTEFSTASKSQSASELDDKDILKKFRSEFLFPKSLGQHDVVYLAGNSLGLQPKKVQTLLLEVCEDWKSLGVEGHIKAKNPWLPYHELVTQQLARLVGAQNDEVVAMGSCTANLHLMMVSFYRPQPKRFKILVEKSAFPSDQYAIASQVRFHGFEPSDAIIEIAPNTGSDLINFESFEEAIEKNKDSLALILIGNVNYLSGQYYSIPKLCQIAKKYGIKIGFDLAHGIGNLKLNLHDDGPDFAVWCSYKYLNSGPGAIAGLFVHNRHAKDLELPRFAGWWGHNKSTRFQMGPHFDPISGAEGWQLSNPPIFQLAALRASLELFDQAGMDKLREKSVALTEYALGKIKNIAGITCITPQSSAERGTQLSLKVEGNAKALCSKLYDHGVVCDYREPGIIRIAPAPLYTRFEDIDAFTNRIEALL